MASGGGDADRPRLLEAVSAFGGGRKDPKITPGRYPTCTPPIGVKFEASALARATSKTSHLLRRGRRTRAMQCDYMPTAPSTSGNASLIHFAYYLSIFLNGGSHRCARTARDRGDDPDRRVGTQQRPSRSTAWAESAEIKFAVVAG
jgi:hypothetical protein